MAEYPYIPEYNKEPENNGASGTMSILGGIAAAVGISVVAPEQTRRALNSVSRFGARGVEDIGKAVSYIARRYGTQAKQTGSFIKGVDYALEGQSPFRLLFGNQERINQRFAQSYERSMETINRQGSHALKGMPTRIEEDLHGLRGRFSQQGNRSSSLANSHFNAVRFEAVSRRLKERLPEKFHNGLDTILSNERDEFFSDPNVPRIEGLLRRYGEEQVKKTGKQFSLTFTDEKERKNFIDTMMSTLDQYKNRKSVGMSNRKVLREGGELDTGLYIQGSRQVRNTEIKNFLDRNQVDHSTLLNKAMEKTGHRQAQMKDFLRKDENGKWVNGGFDLASIQGYRRGDASLYDEKMGNKLARYANFMEKKGLDVNQLLNAAVDPHLFINPSGKLTDLRGIDKGVYKSLSFIRDQFQIPFLKFNPLDLMHWTTYQSIREAPTNYIFRRGTIQPWLGKNAQTVTHPMAHNQDAVVGPLKRDYMFSNNKVYDLVTGEVIKDNMFLASARFGMIPRAGAGMANLHRKDMRDVGFLRKLFDIGNQETQSIWNRGKSVFTKFGDEDWERNTFSKMFSERATDPEFREKAYKNIYSYLNQHSTGFSDRTADFLNPLVKEAYGANNIDLTKLNTTEEIMGTLGKLAVGINKPNSGIVRSKDTGLDKLISHTWNQFQGNPSEFLKNKRIASTESPFVIGSWQAVDPYETNLVNKLDDIKRMIHQHAIEQLEYDRGIGSVGEIVKQGIKDGNLLDNAAHEYRGMSVLNKMQSYWDDIYRQGESAKQEALSTFFADTVASSGDSGFANSMFTQIKHNSNVFSAGPGDQPPQYFGLVGNMAMEKGRGYKWGLERYNERIAKGDGEFRAFGDAVWGVLGQPFAGRKNMDQVTAATMPFYYFAERLDNALGKIGLGLSQKNRGSMQSIMWNQFGRRIVLPYMAVQQLSYFDDQLGNGPSEGLADGYVKAHLGMAAIKEATGLNTIGRYFGDLLPGFDQIGKIPLMAGLKHASFGMIGDNRSPEELEAYYEHGEDPVRRGRWWGVGSNTPWEGGKIDYYTPNWYRRLKSNYKMTDTLYGSQSEYWANNAMPTLTHPFAPLRHFIFDANHYEEKHKDDRPYPVQGGIAELQSIPLIGPMIDNTVGRIVKPRIVRDDLEKQHRAYLEDYNNYIASQYESNTQSGTLHVTAAGGWNLQAGAVSGIGPRYVNSSEGLGGWGGIGYSGSEIELGDEAIDGSMIGGGSTGQISNVKGVSRGELAVINMNILNTRNARSISSLDSLRDPDMIAALDGVANPYGVGNTGSGAFYNLTEMAGIYGFGFRMMTGQSKEDPGFALDQSTRMSSYSRAYWDQNLGSMDGIFGGEFSEIFRRYLPRDPRKQYYNPIKNTMPDWMPGVDYFVDFQHGDPYVKIAKGEMRLPGAAYESLNKLHPDQYGEYGAFDRFKILADVAPYSNEYGFWKRQVSFMRANGMLTPEQAEEATEIRDQVSNRKDKYHYYPYQYKYAKTQEETVNVTRVLDAETFLTKEHPNNPIKLAGVQIPSDATNAQEWLYKQIHEGAKLRIAVDADPLFRIRDDTMNTIRAVVYANEEEGQPFYTSQKGQSLNSILVNRDFGDTKRVTKAPDHSAVGTAAFHDKADITVGTIWENTVHNLGKVPVVGTIFDKFVQVKSPLELYKKNELYGKSWRPWYEPWSGWIEPMISNAASQSPILSAAQGAGIGWLFGRAGIGKRWGVAVGATVMGGAAAVRAIDEALGRTLPGNDDYAWIPKRRQKEREINEYFDVIKYMKFRGLYERASELAKSKEGIDLDKFIGDNEERGEQNKRTREQLVTMKKWLSIQKKLGYYDDETLKEQLDKARDRLGQIAGDTADFALGPYAMQAMQYRVEYESTLYGADPYGDVTQIYRALPDKDRQFFTQFMTAAPEEREEILRLVPKDQKRFYQAKWGMDLDDKPSLSSYFMTHALPGANWEGWRPDVNLENIKLKVARNEGVELTELGMWDDDVKRAEQSGVKDISPFRPSMAIDPLRIEKVLRGAGLKDVAVTMQVSPSKGENRMRIAMDVMKDRSNELLSEINKNMGSFI